MINIENVSKTFNLKSGVFNKKKESITAVKDLNLSIEKGSFHSLIGVNGAGKTTTIKMLSTLLVPSNGHILCDGIDVVKYPLKIIKKINLVSGGDRQLYFRLTVRENLEYFGALYYQKKSSTVVQIKKLAEILDFESILDTRVEQLSQGQKQRVQIARGLINNPEYLFLDEPTIGLDINIAYELRKYLKRTLFEKEGKTILLTSHNLNEVEEMCDYVSIINNGSLLFSGKTIDVCKLVNEKIISVTFDETEDMRIVFTTLSQLSVIREINQTQNRNELHLYLPDTEVKSFLIFLNNTFSIQSFFSKEIPLEDAVRKILEKSIG